MQCYAVQCKKEQIRMTYCQKTARSPHKVKDILC